MSGIPIGIVLLNVGCPIVPGNAANACTWDFPVSYVKVHNVDSPRLHTKDPAIIDELAASAKELVECCGVNDPSCLVVKSMEEVPEFSAIPRDRDTMNNARCREEFIQAAKELAAENPDIGVILLERSDMPPYAAAIQDAVNLPVYGFTTMVNWVKSAVCRKPFHGYI